MAVAGLALDWCVAFTCLDAKRLGFETWLILDASKPVDASYGAGDGEASKHFNMIMSLLKEKGVHVIDSEEQLPEDKFPKVG